MRELPILFSTEMVKAILDGRKTMTRRVVGEDQRGEWVAVNNVRNHEYGASVPCYLLREISVDDKTRNIMYPKYDVGDRLYVRETWADNIPGCPNGITYKADHIDPKGDGPANPIKWKPSLFMPKSAARIWLEVTGVRVERLQEITEGDARAEGFKESWDLTNNCVLGTVKEEFALLWDSLNAKRGYGWDSNPWVWVIEFKRLEA